MKWLAALPVIVAALTVAPSASAGDGMPTWSNSGPSSALPVAGLPFQTSVTLSSTEPVHATDPANAAVAQACNGGAPLYMPRWFRYQAGADVDILIRSSAVPGGPSLSTPVVSPIAWVAADGTTVLGCGITHAFDRQQIGPAFLAAGESAFVVQFVPTMADAVTFATDGYSLHTRIQAAPGSIEGGPSNDSWWTPSRLPSDLPASVSADVGLASLGSVEVELAEDTACWGSAGASSAPLLQPAVWYSYTASVAEPIVLDTSGSDYPLAVVVATESTNGPSNPVCLGSGAARYSFSPDVGTDYLVGVYGYDLNNVNVAGQLSLTVLHPSDPPSGGAAPANDVGTSAPPPPSQSGTPATTSPTEVAVPLVPEPLRFTATPTHPSPSVRVRATGHRSKLSVHVHADTPKGRWTFLVQRKKGDGTWKPMGTYRTTGRTGARTVDLRKGTYRVWVNPRQGSPGVLSGEVHLRR